ncbi:MAG: PIN domain-containing protein [Alphaproteobacteria bacterium]|nr:PIN domain-containing protein [Alphaproteobacteria bacterium]
MNIFLTLDTCVFENYNMNTETMLKHLTPVLKADTKFVLSEIVLLELKSHYETTYRAVSRSIESVQKKLSSFTNNQAVFNKVAELQNFLQKEKASNNALDKYIKETKTEIIPYGNITLNEVVHAYFNMDAPFRPGKKKAEFPDAIAVYSLDKWAANNNCKIMAISSDNDWCVFAEKYPERWSCDKTIEAAVKRLGYHVRG